MTDHMTSAEKRREASSTIEALYRDYADRTYRLAYLLTGNREIAADLTQDAFARVLGRFHHLRKRSSLDSYLKRTVVNLANGYFRRRSTERKHASASNAIEVDDHAARIASSHDLWVSLGTLPARQRAALVLRFYEDMSESEVADILETSVKGVNSLVARGLNALRQRSEMNNE